MEIIVFETGTSISDILAQFLPAVEKGLDIVADNIQSDFLQPTKQWTHKPQFNIIKSTLGREIYTTDNRYVWINDGTGPNRGGEITGKGGKALWLPSKWIAKTRVGDLYGYGGVRDYERGKNVFKKPIKMSKITPRKWDEYIYRLWTEYNDIGDFIQRQINAI